MFGIPIVIKATPKSKRPKGLPKRTGKRKDSKAARYSALVKKKAARNAAQEAQHKANGKRESTPWQDAKAKRFAKRHP